MDSIEKFTHNDIDEEMTEIIDPIDIPKTIMIGGSSNDPNEEIIDPSNEEIIDPSNEEIIEPSNEEIIEPSKVDNENEENMDNENEENMDNEFEIEESNLVFNQNNNIVITDEYIIPESKIIANELDQEEDLINEMIKKLPDNLKTNKNNIKNIKNCVSNFIYLKNKYAIKDEFNEIIDYDDKEFNLVEKYNNFNFSNNYLIPIVSEKNNLYKIYEDEKSMILGENLDSIDSDTIIKKNNEEHIKEQINIKYKYRNTAARKNYKYKNELNETYDSMNPYLYNQSEFIINLENDIYVVNKNSIYFSKNKFTNKENIIHKLLGNYKNELFDNEVLVKGESINITGFLRLPRHKTKMVRLFKDTLNKVVKSDYTSVDLFNNIDTNINENVNLDLEINDNIKIVYFKQNKTILGKIIEKDNETYKIKPLNLENMDNEKPIEVKNNDNVSIFNIEKNNRNELLDDENIFKSYISENTLDKNSFKNFLKHIIPNNNIISHNIQDKIDINSLHDINSYLNYYGITIDNFSFENFETYRVMLNKYHKNIIKDSIFLVDNLNQFLKKENKVPIKNFKMVSNKSLKGIEKYYGIYPYYNNTIDSLQNRVKWLLSREDNGYLYFKTIIKKIEDGLEIDTDLQLTNLNKTKEYLNSKRIKLKNKIDIEKTQIIKNNNKCPNMFITKEYYNLNSLENDNNKEIKIDSDKVIIGESTIVKEQTYAILHNNNTKKLYKRIKLSDGSERWNLETSRVLDQIIKTNKDFCNSQMLSIKTLDFEKDIDTCQFSDIENKCYPKNLTQLLINLKNINSDILENDSNISQLNNHLNESIQTEDLIKYYSDLLVSKYKQKNIKELQLIDNYDNLNKNIQNITPENELVYQKIDLYLEKINKLDDVHKYNLLDKLIKMYGRDAHNHKKENKNNIYYKYGNKVITCKHNLFFIESFKNTDKLNENMDKLIFDYGIENNGYYWCKKCGEKLCISNYETIEGFYKSGARIVTHEEIVDDENQESKYENSLLVATLESYLNQKELNIDNTINISNYHKIIKSILNVIGIKLNDIDHLNLLKDINNLCLSSIKNKYIWETTLYKGKKKKLDKSYEDYVNIYTIVYSISLLFITLQTSIPNYKITKTHNKCVASLEGYPLNEDETYMVGIDYIACILEQFKSTSGIWECLKKLKIKNELKKTISKLSKDNYHIHRYKLKNEYILNNINKNEVIKCNNEWQNFRPLLELFTIDNAYLNTKNTDTIKNKQEALHYYSLKIISEIDTIINNSNIETQIYTITTLDHSCCMDEINADYKNMNYFKKTNNFIDTLQNKINSIDYHTFVSLNTKFIISKPYQNNIPTFSSIILPLEKDIDQSIINELFETYIDEGVFVGYKHLYDDDICILTGQTRNDTKKKNITDYYKLLDKIHSSTLIENKIIEENINILKNLILVVKSNALLHKNIHINNLIILLVKHNTKNEIENIWNDFEVRINVEIDELILLFDDKIDRQKTSTIKEIITNIGECNNIYEEMQELYEEKVALDEFIFNKNKLIKKYITHYLTKIICFIKNNSQHNEEIYIPDSWKVKQVYIDSLLTNVNNQYKKYDKYFSDKNQLLYNKMYNIISGSNKLYNLIGEEHIYKDKNFVRFSKLTNSNISLILKFIFVITLKELLIFNDNPTVKIYEHNFDEKDLNVNIFDDNEYIDSNSDNLFLKGGSSNIEIYNTVNQNIVTELLYDILIDVQSHQKYTDRFTNKKINENIEKASNIQKEKNLKIMEELNKEGRQTINALLAIGLETYKDLSNKKNINLYFDDRYTKSNENKDTIEITQEENNTININKARELYGENFTEQHLQDMVDTQNNNDREDQLQLDEIEIMPDDDGDFDPYDIVN